MKFHIGTMADSQLHVGGGKRSGSFRIVDHGAILAVIHELVAALPDLGINEADHQDVNAEATTVQPQLESCRPKRAVINKSLKTLSRTSLGKRWAQLQAW